MQPKTRKSDWRCGGYKASSLYLSVLSDTKDREREGTISKEKK